MSKIDQTDKTDDKQVATPNRSGSASEKSGKAAREAADTDGHAAREATERGSDFTGEAAESGREMAEKG
jgi:hypothetical protein